jgi:hypothetical protein
MAVMPQDDNFDPTQLVDLSNMDKIRDVAEAFAGVPAPEPESTAIQMIAPNDATSARIAFAMETALDYVVREQGDAAPVTLADVGDAIECLYYGFADKTILGKARKGDLRGAHINRIALVAQLSRMRELINELDLPPLPEA